MLKYQRLILLPLLALAMLTSGCPFGSAPPPDFHVLHAPLTDPLRAVPREGAVELAAARNEVVNFTFQIDPVPAGTEKKPALLRIKPPQLAGGQQTVPLESLTAYQVLPMPIDDNRAGFVRHTGLPVSTHRLPRALLPLPMQNGAINLAALRDPGDPVNPKASAAGKSALIWIDIAVPTETHPGEYEGGCEVGLDNEKGISLPVKLNVYDFVIPDERHLAMVSPIAWEGLVRLYPELFEAVTPNLLSRKDPRYGPAMKTLDQIVKLAQAHRTVVTIPRLQPIVKWNVEPPTFEWEDFDSVVGPWVNGNAFADHVPLSYWPLPRLDKLESYDKPSQRAYWRGTASHFDALEWLGRSSVQMELGKPGRATVLEQVQLSGDAAEILGAYPRIRVSVPLEEGQVQFADGGNANLIDKKEFGRVLTAAPGLISALQPPEREDASLSWLRTDLPGLIPYVGSGADEREVRLWAWLAFLRNARLVQWSSPLPRKSSPKDHGDPDDLVWFYPGSWFGVDQPVPTVQIKWLRRAQQDYEYLWLARQRDEFVKARSMARVITKPVEIQPLQNQEPAYALMCGTSDPQVWTDALSLLARVILLHPPGQQVDPNEQTRLELAVIGWMTPLDRPMLMGRWAQWGFGVGKGPANNTIDLRLGIDIYNATETRPAQNTLAWAGVPTAWEIAPKPVSVPQLLNFSVLEQTMEARVKLDKLADTSRQPVDIIFTYGENQTRILMRLMLPVAITEQREGDVPRIDGSLEDWGPADNIHSGPFVRFLSRPSVQKQELPFASTSSQLFSAWTDNNLYLAWRLEGVEAAGAGMVRNFVDYQFRRAWSEDLAEVLIQPIYANSDLGPVVHLVCKPAGQVEVERRLNPRDHANPMQPVAGSPVRYAATVREEPRKDATSKVTLWRGELGIPWDLLNDQQHQGQRPALLRFNFVQHRNSVGESASWAGPIDYGRDEAFTGLLEVRANRRR